MRLTKFIWIFWPFSSELYGYFLSIRVMAKYVFTGSRTKRLTLNKERCGKWQKRCGENE